MAKLYTKNGSDHMLLKASLTIRLAFRKKKPPPRYNVARLQAKAVAEEFRLELSNRFDILSAGDDNEPATINIEEEWRNAKDTIKDASKNSLAG
jgi:predicted secreted protein